MELVKFNEDLSIDNMTTDEALEILCKYGEPRLAKLDGGWYSSIEVFITGKGIDFKVKTNFEQSSPNEAARNCLRLLIKAIKQIKETT